MLKTCKVVVLFFFFFVFFFFFFLFFFFCFLNRGIIFKPCLQRVLWFPKVKVIILMCICQKIKLTQYDTVYLPLKFEALFIPTFFILTVN